MTENSENFREYKKCNICGSSDSKVIYAWEKEYYLHQEYETSSWDGSQAISLNIVKCSSCDLVYSKPSFREEFLELVYPEALESNKKHDFNKMLSSNKWKEIIDEVQRYLPKKSFIVDIGTKHGILVKQLSNLSYQAKGLEYNKESVKIANEIIGTETYQGGVPNINKMKINRIHAFILDDVLEHLVNPMRDIQILSSFQKKGDFLFLRQMDFDSLGHKLYKKRWYYLQPAAHMYYFNSETLKKLLLKNNYKIIKIQRESIFKSFKKIIYNLLLDFKIFSKKEQVSKKSYLQERRKLNDMFFVTAQKIK